MKIKNMIRAIKIEPGQKPELVDLENELHALQDAVSIGSSYRGLIETLRVEPGVTLLFNEEGKLLRLPPNMALYF